MNSIAFTGTSRLQNPAKAHALIYETILALALTARVDEFHSGGAYGADTKAAIIAHALYPEAAHILHVPYGCYWNERLTDLVKFDEVRYITDGYMKRNDSLVASASRLIAFPKTADEELRSGTWATIRRARKAGVPVLMFPLS
jgi:hypothetical protein